MKELALSLLELENTIEELFRERDLAESEGDTEAVQVIDKAIEEWALEHLKAQDAQEMARKVDRTAGSVRFCEARAREAREIAQRAADHAKAWEARVERIKKAMLYAMQARGLKEVKSATNTLRRQGNGGLQALEVLNEADVPEAYRLATVTMSLHLLRSICRDLSEVDCREIYKTVTSTDNEAIRKTLAERILCPECQTGCHEIPDCKRCGGVGTIPATVPGARLLPRGETLRII